MKAAQINEYGDASVVQVVDVETPTITDDQVLVEVMASSINPFDTTVRLGRTKDSIPLELPVTLGGDIAGVVKAVGQNVSTLAVGDKVYGQASAVAGNSGAFAEYAATSANQVALSPSNVSFEEAAALPLVGASAVQALKQHINLQPGQKIFIHGGAGGIGTVAIQIAKSVGAYVATTASNENADYVKGLGADEVVDYKTQNFTEVLHDFNAVFDTVGGDDFMRALSTLKAGGVAVSMIAPPVDEGKAAELGVTALTQSTHVTTEVLNNLRELIESGVITPHVDKVFTLDQIKEAFEARENGTVKGKIVLKIAG